MKVKQLLLLCLTVVIAVGIVSTSQVNAEEFDLQKADIHDRMTYHRAVDAAVWAMPLMNFKFYRDALANAGVGPSDVGYFEKLQDWTKNDDRELSIFSGLATYKTEFNLDHVDNERRPFYPNQVYSDFRQLFQPRACLPVLKYRFDKIVAQAMGIKRVVMIIYKGITFKVVKIKSPARSPNPKQA